MRIERRPEGDASGLVAAGISPLLARLYAARGIKQSDEIDAALQGLLHYRDLSGIDTAATVIANAVMQRKRILVVGDYDCDGATSCALAVLALRSMGASWVHYLVPNRFEYGYGLSAAIVDVAIQQRPDLIITVDNGIASIDGVAHARALGVQVVVTDHHLPGQELPAADALVNPNQPGCAFSGKNTCGVGVIFYVMMALRRQLEMSGWFAGSQHPLPNLAELLDLVALGTVADVVSLDRNNRILVEQGLRRMRAGRARPGLLALMAVAKRQTSEITASDLGFALAPRLNAAGRLDDMALGIRLLLTEDQQEAHALAVELDNLNRERRGIEQSMQQEALIILDAMDLQGELPVGLCLFEPGWHEGVIGILASRIKERLNRPVIAFAAAGDGLVKGSARSIAGFHIRDALAQIASEQPALLRKFGGHAMAAGLTLSETDLARFREAFDLLARAQLSEAQLQARIETDGALGSAELTMATAEQLRFAGPWGQHFPEPRFDGEFRVLDQRIVGERHLKLVLESVDGLCLDAIAFNVDTRTWPRATERVRLVYRPDINQFRGNRTLQLQVDYLEAC